MKVDRKLSPPASSLASVSVGLAGVHVIGQVGRVPDKVRRVGPVKVARHRRGISDRERVREVLPRHVTHGVEAGVAGGVRGRFSA